MFIPQFSIELLDINTKRRSGQKITSKRICFVDHDTGNPNSTARQNVSYYRRTQNEVQQSAHAFIDDKETIVILPLHRHDKEKAWHVLYNVTTDNALWGDDANDLAIGSELSYFPGDIPRTLKAYNRYIEFQAWVAYEHGANPYDRAGHFMLDPARRSDPNGALKVIGKTYQNMVDDIGALYNKLYKQPNRNDIVNPSDYAKEAMAFAKSKGISDGSRPLAYLTRLEAWLMLYRFKFGKETSNEAAFSKLKELKITDGTEPSANVTRVQIWSMLARIYGVMPKEDWYSEANLWVVKNSISDGTNPDALIERQQLWVMLWRLRNKK